MTERSENVEPTTHDLIVELRETLGLFAGAMPISPQQAWGEAIERVRLLTTGRCHACIGPDEGAEHFGGQLRDEATS